MKTLIIFSLFSSYIISTHLPKSDDFRFPGTTEVVANFFVDQREICNIDWREYMYALQELHGATSPIYLRAQPDTSVWDNTDSSYLVPFKNTYFTHPAYDNFPVVGISHAQAVSYCKWRTDRVREMLRSYDVQPPKFKYRLPTKTEWELIANAGYSKKQRKHLAKIEKKKDYDGIFRTCNMIYSGSKSAKSMLAPARTYYPNKYNVYNIYGNAAEMVAEPNIAMGGSHRHSYYDIVPTNKEIPYDGPQHWLGFRCVAEILDK